MRELARHESLGDLVLVRGERGQNFVFLSLLHLDKVERPLELRRYFIELIGRDLESAMGLFETNRRVAWFGGLEIEWSARYIAYPERSHEFQTRQPRQVLGVPLSQGRV